MEGEALFLLLGLKLKNDKSFHVREPRTVLDSGFHARDSFRIPGIESRSMSVELGFRVPIFSDIRGSKPRIPVPRANL